MNFRIATTTTSLVIASIALLATVSGATVTANVKLNSRRLISANKVSSDLPEEFDWRKVPERVGSVRTQGRCISDGAAAVTGVLEGQFKARNVSFIDLSVQNLIDCATVKEDACQYGGSAEQIMNELSKLGGIQSEADYPYKEELQDCRYNSSKSVLSLKGVKVERVPYSDEEALKRTIVDYGPVAITMGVEPFLEYSSGVRDCGDFAAVTKSALLVGYGNDPNEGKYWIVQNNHGENWGEQGYIRIARSKGDRCHVTMYAYIVEF